MWLLSFLDYEMTAEVFAHDPVPSPQDEQINRAMGRLRRIIQFIFNGP